MELGLRGRVAAITGGSKGIGRAIARALAGEGVDLVLRARGKDQLEHAAEEIRQVGVRVITIPTDIMSSDSVNAAAGAVKGQFSTVHIVINNAGGPIRRVDRQITWAHSAPVDGELL